MRTFYKHFRSTNFKLQISLDLHFATYETIFLFFLLEEIVFLKEQFNTLRNEANIPPQFGIFVRKRLAFSFAYPVKICRTRMLDVARVVLVKRSLCQEQ